MYTADRHSSARGWWSLMIAIVMLVMLGIVLGGQGGAMAAAEPLADATATPEQIANESPADMDPFPTTDAMTDTVQAVLADYEQAGAGAADGQGVAADAGSQPEAVPMMIMVVHLPVVQGVRQSPPPPPPTEQPAKRADIAVSVWPSPSIRVMRGATLQYELRVKNYGEGGANQVRVTLPYVGSQMRARDSSFTRSTDWVSALTSDRVTVTFGPIAPGQSVTAQVRFTVSTTLPDDTVINMRASYDWSDAGGSSSWRTNWAPLLVGSGNATASWLWMTVNPSAGAPGTTHRFFTDRFIPGEGIVTWLNTPAGVKALTLKGTADTYGRVTLDFSSSGLAPGNYSLVAYGARSNLTAVASFTVRW